MAKRKRSQGQSGNDAKVQNKKLSKNQKRHMRKLQKLNGSKAEDTTKDVQTKINPSPNQSAALSQTDKLDLGQSSIRPKSALQQSFLSRLAGSRFRELNEELYTSNSSSAFEKFQSNPELFDQYHEGFRTQVESWPVNPLDVVFKWVVNVNRTRSKEEKKKSKLRVADFGCGDAKLAARLLNIKETKKKNNKRKKNNAHGGSTADEKKTGECPFEVHSFDLVANGNPHITPCDMANVPIPDRSVDVAVFVLALMGTNIADFIREAHRVLTPDGRLKIAEVRSRFESASSENSSKQSGGKGKGKQEQSRFKYSNKKGDDSLLTDFITVMSELGFKCRQKDRSNKMFILLEFEKTGKKPSNDATFTAKPCIYKRR